MPMQTVYVTKVFPPWIAANGVKRYEIVTRPSAEQRVGDLVCAVSFHDGDKGQLAASLCQRAMELQRPILLGIRDTRYGPEIVTAEWPTDQESAA